MTRNREAHFDTDLANEGSENLAFHAYGPSAYDGDEDTGFLSVKEVDQPVGVVVINRDEARKLAAVLSDWANAAN